MVNKNFGLTEQEYLDMVIEMKMGKEDLFEHIFLSHFEKTMKFTRNKYKLSYEQAYDACMDSLLEFRRGLMEDKYTYGNLNYLFSKMAGQRFFKNVKKDNRFEAIPQDVVLPDQELFLDADEKIVLDRAWSKLGEGCRNLLKNYYYNNIKLTVLAEIEDRKPESLRKQKQRCLNTLRMNFQRIMKPINA